MGPRKDPPFRANGTDILMTYSQVLESHNLTPIKLKPKEVSWSLSVTFISYFVLTHKRSLSYLKNKVVHTGIHFVDVVICIVFRLLKNQGLGSH